MTQSYIPVEDSLALVWMTAFSAGITANPALYMVAVGEASALAAAVDAYDAAYQIAMAPSTRTKSTISAKSQTRNSAEQICRQYVILIKHNAGISDQAKIDIGVRPVNTSREPIYCPQSSPLVNVLGNTPGTQTLRYADSATPDSGAKPFGAMQLQVFVAIATEPTANADDAEYYGGFTKNPIPVAFAEADDGKVATYFARWVGRKGDIGPWSQAISMRIAA